MPLSLGLFAYMKRKKLKRKEKAYGFEESGKRCFGECRRRRKHCQYYELFYSCPGGAKGLGEG